MKEKDFSFSKLQKEFFENVHIYTKTKMSFEDAKNLLEHFLYLSSITPPPPVMDIFREPESLDRIGVYTPPDVESREFMLKFLAPILHNFRIEGIEHLDSISKVMDNYPITLVSNHISHLDAPGIFQQLYHSGEIGRKIAERLIFVAGRLAFESDFTRLGLYMFGTLLVCSKRDMADNPSLTDLMTRINMRAYRTSQKLQQEKKIIAVFPEGTRSRDGRLMPFVDSVFHYVSGTIVLPISLEGTDKILPTTSFLLHTAHGKLTIGKPVYVGDLNKKISSIPAGVDHLPFPTIGDKRQFVVDNLALLVGANLNKHKHGTYRNLYNGDKINIHKNVLISTPKNPIERIVVIGRSSMSLAVSTILSNKDVTIQIYTNDKEIADQCNSERRDIEYFPIYKLPPNITYTADVDSIANATTIIQGSNPWAIDKIYPFVQDVISESSAPVLNVVKGFSPTKYGIVIDDLNKEYKISLDRIAVASGAGYPDQIMERKFSGFEIASQNKEHLKKFIKLLTTGYIYSKPAINQKDILGVYLGSALKTTYAISMGILESYFKQTLGGHVDNTTFHLSNIFFKEMVRIGIRLGGLRNTFYGLSGYTEFMLACFGSDNVDKRFGYDLAMGIKTDKYPNGYYGILALDKLLKVTFDEYPIIYSTKSFVTEHEPLDKIVHKLQERLIKM